MVGEAAMPPLTRPNPTLIRHLFMCALAVAAILALSPCSQAAPVYFTETITYDSIITLPYHGLLGTPVDLDLDKDGTADVQLTSSASAEPFIGRIFKAMIQPLGSTLLATNDPLVVAAALPFGTAIGPFPYFGWTTEGDLCVGGDLFPYGNWQDDLNARGQYLGVRFLIGGQVHYGWIEAATAVDEVNYTISVRVTGYGYETDADTPVTAGVPEPSSLALFALGATGIAALARRRRPQA